MDFIIIYSDQYHNLFSDGKHIEAREATNLGNAIQKKIKEKYNINIDVYKDISKDDLSDEITYAKKFKNKTVINLHSNAGPSEASGVEGIYYSTDLKMKEFATLICNKISQASGLKVRRIFSDDELAMIGGIPNPSILIETFFHTNLNDIKAYFDNFYKIVEAYCDGIAEFAGVKPIKKDIPENKENIPQWKIDGEKWLFENGIITSRHSPTETVDFGELGVILRRFALNSITSK